MAIVECSFCKELFNEDEQYCPFCGEEIRKTPVRKANAGRKPKGRRLILGLPLGKWVAALIFLIAAALFVLCVYICLSLNGKVDSDIANKIDVSGIGEITKPASDKTGPTLIWENEIGKLESSDEKGYSKFYSSNLNFSCLIPEGYSVVEEDGSVFICPSLSDDGSYSIPYIMIDKDSEFNDEVELLKDKYIQYSDGYKEQNFKIKENIYRETLESGRAYYGFKFTYTASSYEILDVRRALKVNDSIFLIASKGLADETVCIDNNDIYKLIDSFELN